MVKYLRNPIASSVQVTPVSDNQVFSSRVDGQTHNFCAAKTIPALLAAWLHGAQLNNFVR